VLIAGDDEDPDLRPGVGLDLGPDWTTRPLGRPRLAFVRTPVWEHTGAITRDAFAGLCERWGDLVQEVKLPPAFERAHDWHKILMESDLANSLGALYNSGRDRMSDTLREMIERGQTYKAMDYSRARDGIFELNRQLDRIFASHDAILTPATSNAAPAGLAFTGSPMFCTLWTFCGVPAISLPILAGEAGMPMGAQLVARKGADARLLELARGLMIRERRAPGR
jgi:Asp-tRNA(Asn)/Glu-tRNA(Gln) amidotransferase A subunit family amidase